MGLLSPLGLVAYSHPRCISITRDASPAWSRSDVDLLVCNLPSHLNATAALRALTQRLAERPWVATIQLIEKARVPVIKVLTHVSTYVRKCLLTHLLAYSLTYSFTHSLTHLPVIKASAIVSDEAQELCPDSYLHLDISIESPSHTGGASTRTATRIDLVI